MSAFERASISPPQVVRHPSASQPWIIPAVVWAECDCSSNVQSGKRCNKSRSHCRDVYRSCKTHMCTVATSGPRVDPTSTYATMTTNSIWPVPTPATRAVTTVHSGTSTKVMVKSDTEEMSTAPVNTNTTNVLIGALLGGLALVALVIILVVITKMRRKNNRSEEEKSRGLCTKCLACCPKAKQRDVFDDPVYIPPDVIPREQQESRSADNLTYEETIPPSDVADEVQHDYEQVYPETENARYEHLNLPNTSPVAGHRHITIMNHPDSRYSTVDVDSASNADNAYSTIKYSGESRKYFELEKSEQTNTSKGNTNVESDSGVYYGISPVVNLDKKGNTYQFA